LLVGVGSGGGGFNEFGEKGGRRGESGAGFGNVVV